MPEGHKWWYTSHFDLILNSEDTHYQYCPIFEETHGIDLVAYINHTYPRESWMMIQVTFYDSYPEDREIIRSTLKSKSWMMIYSET
jgi:hypothetical protein